MANKYLDLLGLTTFKNKLDELLSNEFAEMDA